MQWLLGTLAGYGMRHWLAINYSKLRSAYTGAVVLPRNSGACTKNMQCTAPALLRPHTHLRRPALPTAVSPLRGAAGLRTGRHPPGKKPPARHPLLSTWFQPQYLRIVLSPARDAAWYAPCPGWRALYRCWVIGSAAGGVFASSAE